MTWELYEGDNLEIMPRLIEQGLQFDSLVTDVPYEQGFMNKSWDKSGIAYNVDMWKMCFDLLKPGAYLLSFGGCRTYHRIAVAIEDAGFIIHPMIAWVFGSGFPKATNLSKMLDKQAGTDRKVVNTVKMPDHRGDNYGQGKRKYENIDYSVTIPATPEAKQWDGWYYGLQSLKPALEPICMAQKPPEGRMTDNVLKWGTGAVNIDGCRIPLNGEQSPTGSGKPVKGNADIMSRALGNNGNVTPPGGRFPANLIHDGSEEVLAGFPQTKSGSIELHHKTRKCENVCMSGKNYERPPRFSPSSSGSASRFFKKCEQEEYKCQDQSQNLLNADIVEKNLSLQKKVEYIVQNLVAIEECQEDRLLKSMIAPFMKEMRKTLKENSEKNTKQIKNTGRKCLQELRHTSTEMLSGNPVRYAEILRLINTMMIIQNLLSIDGFVENVMSDIMLKNMVLGERGCQFKYCAKASKKERGEGNKHPTVKPLALMKYLCRLITPPGGTILDPFAGSGTTLVAGTDEGFNVIGIELSSEYCDIIRRRMSNRQMTLFETGCEK